MTKHVRQPPPDHDHPPRRMRESFRMIIITLLVTSLVGFGYTVWQVRKLRGSLTAMQQQLEEQSGLLRQTEAQLALTVIERDGFHDAYDKLKVTLTPPVTPTPPSPCHPRHEKRPVPVFSRDSQFSARPRKRLAHSSI